MTRLSVEKRDELLIELYTAVLGIRNTEENGMVGDLKEPKSHVLKQNGKIMKNRIMIFALIFFLVGCGVLEWQDVIHIFGV